MLHPSVNSKNSFDFDEKFIAGHSLFVRHEGKPSYVTSHLKYRPSQLKKTTLFQQKSKP